MSISNEKLVKRILEEEYSLDEAFNEIAFFMGHSRDISSNFIKKSDELLNSVLELKNLKRKCINSCG